MEIATTADVIKAIRKANHFDYPGGRKHFADAINKEVSKRTGRTKNIWTDEVVRNLETLSRTGWPRRQFDIPLLQDLRIAGMIKEGSELEQRLLQAMDRQAEAIAEGKMKAKPTPKDTSQGAPKSVFTEDDSQISVFRPVSPVEPIVPPGTLPTKSHSSIRSILIISSVVLGLVVIIIIGAYASGIFRDSKNGVPTTKVGEQTTKSPTKLAETPVTSPKPTQLVLIDDSFSHDISSDWEVVTGDWRIINGKLSTITRYDWSYMMRGDNSWKNYAVYFEVDGTNDKHSDFYILVRAIDINNAVYFKIHNDQWNARYCSLVLVLGGKETKLSDCNGYCNEGNIRIEVKGNIYTAYSDEKPICSVSDSTFSSGRVGFGMYCGVDGNCNTTNHFKVIALQ